DNDVIDERPRRDGGELARERLDDDGVDAGLGEELDAALDRGEHPRGLGGREQGRWVGIEGERDGERVAGGGELARAVDQGAVADVNSVEVADRERCAFPRGSAAVPVHDLHGATLTRSVPDVRGRGPKLDSRPRGWCDDEGADRRTGDRLTRWNANHAGQAGDREAR